jgi:hypothetical protein
MRDAMQDESCCILESIYCYHCPDVVQQQFDICFEEVG